MIPHGAQAARLVQHLVSAQSIFAQLLWPDRNSNPFTLRAVGRSNKRVALRQRCRRRCLAANRMIPHGAQAARLVDSAVPGRAIWFLGFRFEVLGFGFWVLGFGFWGLGLGFWVLDFGFGVLGFEVDWGLAIGVWGFEFWVWVQSLGA